MMVMTLKGYFKMSQFSVLWSFVRMQENLPNKMTIVLMRGMRVTGSKAGPSEPP